MKCKAVLFDLDGTVLDTLPDIVRVTNQTLKELGHPARTAEEIIWMIGNGMKNLLTKALPEDVEVTDEMLARMQANYIRYQNTETRQFPGIAELLAALHAAGIRTAIVTNKPDPAAKEVAEKYFPGLMDYTVGIRIGEAVKPDPHTAIKAMQYLGVTPEETLYVGDSDTDAETAANAGVRFFGAAWGYRGEAFLRAHGAKDVLEKPMDLMGYLE